MGRRCSLRHCPSSGDAEQAWMSSWSSPTPPQPRPLGLSNPCQLFRHAQTAAARNNMANQSQRYRSRRISCLKLSSARVLVIWDEEGLIQTLPPVTHRDFLFGMPGDASDPSLSFGFSSCSNVTMPKLFSLEGRSEKSAGARVAARAPLAITITVQWAR